MSTQQEHHTADQTLVSATNINTVINPNTVQQLQSNGGSFGDLPVTSTVIPTTEIKEEKPKSDEPPKIKRPMNPFMIFGCEKRRKLAQVHPRMHNSEISKILGAEWKRMSEYEKAPYIQEAKRLKEQHSIEYPNYKFKANRRKPRQPIKKERPTFPYAGADLNSLPTAMKFPYPTPFFQDPMYGSMYPAIGSSSHAAYSSMYSDYSSAIARQSLPPSSALRTAVQTPATTASTGEYYSLNKNATGGSTTADFYGSIPSKSDYYSVMHSGGGGGTSSGRASAERSSTAGGEIINLSDRYASQDNRGQFENRYNSSAFNGSQGASSATYTSMQNISSHVSNESTPPAAYSYSPNIYEQRH